MIYRMEEHFAAVVMTVTVSGKRTSVQKKSRLCRSKGLFLALHVFT